MRLGAGFLLAAVALGAAAGARGADPVAPAPYLPVLSAYIQVRDTEPEGGEGTWAIRRLKAMLDGGPKDRLRYHVQLIYKTNLGSSTDDQVFLQDAYVVLPAFREVALKVGQFVPPFGLERFEPDWNLDLVDRTDVTNRMVVNGNLGKSFARDRGVEGDWERRGWQLSAGLFQGEGANMNARGNGPLGVARASYGRVGAAAGPAWSWRMGLAVSDRRDEDLDLSTELPGLPRSVTAHFAGRDSRLNAFVSAGWGRLRGQAEVFRTWLAPRDGAEIAPQGAYAQAAYLPIPRLVLALRYEWFTSDLHATGVPSLRRRETAATYDVPRVRLRVVADYVSSRGSSGGNTQGWRFQIQYWLIKGLSICP